MPLDIFYIYYYCLHAALSAAAYAYFIIDTLRHRQNNRFFAFVYAFTALRALLITAFRRLISLYCHNNTTNA